MPSWPWPWTDLAHAAGTGSRGNSHEGNVVPGLSVTKGCAWVLCVGGILHGIASKEMLIDEMRCYGSDDDISFSDPYPDRICLDLHCLTSQRQITRPNGSRSDGCRATQNTSKVLTSRQVPMQSLGSPLPLAPCVTVISHARGLTSRPHLSSSCVPGGPRRRSFRGKRGSRES